MAWSRGLFAVLLCIAAFSAVESSVASLSAEEEATSCPELGFALVDLIRPRCPLQIELTLPTEVDGKSLEKLVKGLTSASKRDSYYSVLVYAKWCPFSNNFRPMFDALSSMFPQVTHLALEESTATPGLFSKYGVRSVPTLLLIRGTSSARFTDTKDISSLVAFYKEKTGFEPVAYFDVQSPNFTYTPIWLQDIPLKEKVAAEPYLALSVVFVLLRVALWILPFVVPHLRAFWIIYAQGLKQKVVGGMNHILERAAHVLDVKRFSNKLRSFNKKRSLGRGAKSASVWASSLASVSLGECSTSSRHAT